MTLHTQRNKREQEALERLMTTRPDTVARGVALYAALVRGEEVDDQPTMEKALNGRDDAVPILLYALGYFTALSRNLRDSSPELAAQVESLIRDDMDDALDGIPATAVTHGH